MKCLKLLDVFDYLLFEYVGFGDMYFRVFVVFVLYFVIFNACIGFGVGFCRYEHILIRCFNNVRKQIQNCKQLRYELFFVFCMIVGSKWSPHPHPQRQCQSFLPGETIYENKCWRFLIFLKMKNNETWD